MRERFRQHCVAVLAGGLKPRPIPRRSLSMDTSTPAGVPAASDVPAIDFPQPAAPAACCSFNECLAGHRWPPVLATVNCGGCGSPILAVQKANCPFCNEPTVRTVLRSDFVPRGAGAAKRCLGQEVNGESMDIDLERHAWREVESDTELFEERRCKERSAVDES